MLLCCQPFVNDAKTIEFVDNQPQAQHCFADSRAFTSMVEPVISDYPVVLRQKPDEKRCQAAEAVAGDEQPHQPDDGIKDQNVEVEVDETKDDDVKDMPEAQQAGIEVVFREFESAALHTVIFHSQPTGMDFHIGSSPIKVRRVTGAARALGVKETWTLVSVAGTNVEALKYDAIIKMFQSNVVPLRPGFILEFQDPRRGAQLSVEFPTQPLGLEFEKGVTPVKIIGVSGAAKLLGVSEGMELVSIAGTDVRKMDFNCMFASLQNHIASFQKAA